MASSTYKTIVVEQVNRGGVKFKEALAGEASITPGDLLSWSSATEVSRNTGAAGTVQTQKLVAVESPTADTSGGSAAIDTDYSSGDTVKYYVPQRGDVLYMWLADGENASKGSPLGSDGADFPGALQVLTLGAGIYEEAVLGYAAEAKNNSAGTVPVRILVEVA